MNLLPYSYVKINDCLRLMLQNNLIRLTGHGAGKHYALLEKGKQELTAFNPQRYPRCLFADNNTLLRDHIRAMAIGDSAAMLVVSGYAVHPHDKPCLPAHTPVPDDDSGGRQIYQNRLDYQYPGSGDDAYYPRRKTPVNCFYSSVEIKRYFKPKNDMGLRYSRACGVLFTPDYLLRVFHSRDVALEYKATGENKLKDSLQKIFTDKLPPYRQGLLVLGDGFKAAEKILETEFNPERAKMLRVTRKTCIGPKNLGTPLFYFPVLPESLPMLRLLQFPGWEGSVSPFMARQLYKNYRERNDVYFAEGDDGTVIYIGLSLNLTSFARLMRDMRERARNISFICLNWQKEFYETMLKRYTGENAEYVRIITATNDAVRFIESQLSDSWG